MPRKESKVFPEGNGLIPMLGGITPEDFRRALSEMRGEVLREVKKNLRSMDRHLAGLEPDARHPSTSCHGGRRASKHEDLRAHGGRRQSSSSEVRR